MAIKGKTFDLQTITAKDDGALYRILSGESDMIVFSGSGTALSINSNILTIAECYLLVGGRYIHIEDGSTIDLGTIPNSSNRGRVILKIDTSLGATQVTLEQVVTEIETTASGGSYRALVKNDINSDNGGSVYEIEFATFTCSSGVASSPALTTSVPTQTKIQALQDDIETLADNLEQTASDVGDLQALGLSVPIPVNKGGSGLTSSPSMLTNLASTAAATIMQASPRPGVTGTLPIANGGTGATAKATALANLGGMPLLSYTSSDTWVPEEPNLTHIENIYAFAGKNAIVECNYTGSNYKFIAIIDWGNANYGGMMILSQRAYKNIQTWRKGNSWYRTDLPDIVKVTYTNEGLTGLNAKQLSVASSEVISGSTFGTLTANRTYITLPAGRYRIHTNFRANPGANGFIKTCLKIGNTSTLFVITDQFYAGAGCGTNGSIIGVNATDVIKLTANTNIYFLVMSQNNTDGCEGSLTIERFN